MHMEHPHTGGFVTRPDDIERQSFAIITRELGDLTLPEDVAPVVKRVIHTSADFDYLVVQIIDIIVERNMTDR